jgi:hypothetical protein
MFQAFYSYLQFFFLSVFLFIFSLFSQVAFKSYLGISPVITNWNSDKTECSLILDDNPLTIFVELPPEHSGLNYSNIIVGVLRGCLEMVRERGGRIYLFVWSSSACLVLKSLGYDVLLRFHIFTSLLSNDLI